MSSVPMKHERGVRLLVIGASGPTGLAMITQACERGFLVRALVRNPTRLPPTLPKGVEVVRGDVFRCSRLSM